MSTGRGLLDSNMFAYCWNNPVIRSDVAGTNPLEQTLPDDSSPWDDHENFGRLPSGGSGGWGGSWQASLVCFWKWIEQEEGETGETKEVPFLRYYNVFHIDQCEGITAKHTQENTFPGGASTVENAQNIIFDYLGRTGVKLLHQEGDRAFYRPSTDEIILPIRKQFVSTAEYYSTVFHELAHSTGHPSRLNLLDKVVAFGSDVYSKEELVAEIGAAALVNHCGLEFPTSFSNNAAYIQNWLSVLKGDKRFIVSAAGKAEKAVNLILNK